MSAVPPGVPAESAMAADISAPVGQQVPLGNPIQSPLDQDFSGGTGA
jgi:hypothetical protein